MARGKGWPFAMLAYCAINCSLMKTGRVLVMRMLKSTIATMAPFMRAPDGSIN